MIQTSQKQWHNKDPNKTQIWELRSFCDWDALIKEKVFQSNFKKDLKTHAPVEQTLCTGYINAAQWIKFVQLRKSHFLLCFQCWQNEPTWSRCSVVKQKWTILD